MPANSVYDLLCDMGEDPERPGLQKTPHRFFRFLMDRTSALRVDPPEIRVMENEVSDSMISIFGIDFFSLCEHHLLPFFGKVHIGYVPNESIIGFSTIGEVVDFFSRRPQLQEEFTSVIFDYLFDAMSPTGLFVYVEAHHLCMSMRGSAKLGHRTVTTKKEGTIDTDEFYSRLNVGRSNAKDMF